VKVAGWAIATMVGLAVVVLGAPRASGQECSCVDKDPAAAVELRITASQPQEHSRIGPDQTTPVVDLRGQVTVLVGEAPALLRGVDIAEVPVLLAVDDGASGDDECAGTRPAAGSDLSLTGQVYREETGPVVWTGPCQGTLTVQDAAAVEASTGEDAWGRGLAISAVVIAGLAVLCFLLALLTKPRAPSPPPAV